MISHLFKIIWNQKRRNLGILTEIFFSFIVLFAVFSFIIFHFERYTHPLGFEYNEVWNLNQYWSNMEGEEIMVTQQLIKDQLKSYPEIESFSFSSGNVPFSGSTSTTYVEYNDQEHHPHIFYVDENYEHVLNLELKEGRWLEGGDNKLADRPIVINRLMKEALFGEENALGKVIERGEDTPWKVVGIVDNFKYRGEFSQTMPRLFFPPSDEFNYDCILLKVKSGADADFEAKLLKDLSQIAKGWTFEVKYLDDMRRSKNNETLVPMIIFLIISGFLIFNVALGLFGVLWQNISKRKEEIGVRRAMGATKRNISWQFIGEVLILTALSLALGIFFAIQMPLLSVFKVKAGVYLLGILTAALFILSLVFICAFYPSRQAALLHPAVALHEE